MPNSHFKWKRTTPEKCSREEDYSVLIHGTDFNEGLYIYTYILET